MTTSTQWQLAEKSAERYQTILTPTILGPFARALVEFAALQESESVVDVGCGTGAAARYAAELVGAAGSVIGIDVNPGMLAVARSLPAGLGATIEWREANVTNLPLPDDNVDVVLCAQTLQFLPAKQASLAEMQRVVKPNGRIVLSLWCDISENPYFDALVDTIAKQLGPETAVGLQSAFALTDVNEIETLLDAAGSQQRISTTAQLNLPFPDLATFIPCHISATPMAAGFDKATPNVQQTIIRDIVEQMKPYEKNGRHQIPFRSHLIMIKP